jgi:hypothetical protein
LELQRDIGQWMSAKTFTNIGAKARVVREMCQRLYEPLVLGHGLFVDVEMARILYFAHFANPKKRQFYANKARAALSGVEVFCDVALEHSTDERKLLADFLRFYVDAVRVRQAFDADELDHIDLHIQALDQRAMDFAYAYSDEQIVATVQFLSAMYHAEHQLRCREFDRCSEYLTEAEEIFSTMQWHSIESHHRVAAVKTALALERNDPEHEDYFQNYINVINRYRCFEYRHGLRELKRRYPSQVPDLELLTLKDNALFVDTTFTHIHPFLTPK